MVEIEPGPTTVLVVADTVVPGPGLVTRVITCGGLVVVVVTAGVCVVVELAGVEVPAWVTEPGVVVLTVVVAVVAVLCDDAEAEPWDCRARRACVKPGSLARREAPGAIAAATLNPPLAVSVAAEPVPVCAEARRAVV